MPAGQDDSAAVVVDHPPTQFDFTTGDADFTTGGTSSVRYAADDFFLAEPESVRRFVWWGGYTAGTIPTGEAFVVRIYSVDSSGLPGTVFSESTLVPQRRSIGL